MAVLARLESVLHKRKARQPRRESSHKRIGAAIDEGRAGLTEWLVNGQPFMRAPRGGLLAPYAGRLRSLRVEGEDANGTLTAQT